MTSLPLGTLTGSSSPTCPGCELCGKEIKIMIIIIPWDIMSTAPRATIHNSRAIWAVTAPRRLALSANQRHVNYSSWHIVLSLITKGQRSKDFWSTVAGGLSKHWNAWIMSHGVAGHLLSTIRETDRHCCMAKGFVSFDCKTCDNGSVF